jgi:hypothetical protein
MGSEHRAEQPVWRTAGPRPTYIREGGLALLPLLAGRVGLSEVLDLGDVLRGMDKLEADPVRQLMALAGLWENWRSPAGKWVRSFAIITTTPNELCAELHDRMPVVLGAQVWPEWLGEEPKRPIFEVNTLTRLSADHRGGPLMMHMHQR